MKLHEIATSRKQSMFQDDLEVNHERLGDMISGARILAIGAAGSIGSETVACMAQYAPAALHIVDQSENELAELVRKFRSAPEPLKIDDFRTLPLDYGSPVMDLFLRENGPYDIILNFAAIKHVRSEKDAYSILQMLDTNLVKQERFMGMIGRNSPNATYFSVSTDKAANPSSFMGVSKRLMEHVLFDKQTRANLKGKISSARFANVAFSNGSLLQSFENRMKRREPIAAPKDIRRYFVSLPESGQICTLASCLVEDSHIAVPDLEPEKCLVTMESIARGFIEHHGYKPFVVDDEQSAKAAMETEPANGRWPLLLTPADTGGEKPYEEFVAERETVVKTGLKGLHAVPYLPIDSSRLKELLETLSQFMDHKTESNRGLEQDRLKDLIGLVEPEFARTHRASKKNLDQRM